MENIKIAVIDTGIDINDNDIKKNIKFDKSIQLKNISEYEDLDDIHGHGTYCAKTILEICGDISNIEIYPVKIFDNRGTTSNENLVKALENILDSDIDIVNISASTMNDKYKRELENICYKLQKNGKIIISSHHKRAIENDSFPTIFKSVIGVDGSYEIYRDSDYIYRRNNKIQMIANKNERFIEFNKKVTHFGKSSRACAVVTGIICNIFNHYGKLSFDELGDVLEKQSMTLVSKSKGGSSYKSTPYRLELAEKILYIIRSKFAVEKIDLDFLDKYSTFNNFTNIGNHNAFDFLTEINNAFDLNIDYRERFLYELEDLNSTVDLIEKSL
ncbi:S8 family serine peptidase [Romboutsia sedimentorum]|uniref:S8 family serine peptidase n=1 Tax=Romboutsia sedimentorum TaxID=1368474 RepID=UPI0024DEFF79|nr:S8 family serine peptidase [Romboutsia sedimentorum]MDK2587389.1 S8 family serine peptidase [Romboutsia sedimentorum]